MSLFYLLIALISLGFGAIAFFMVIERKKEQSEKDSPEKNKPAITPQDLISRLGLENKNSPPKPIAKLNPLPDLFNRKAANPKEAPAPPSLLKDPLSPKPAIPSTPEKPPLEIQQDAKAESELSLKYDELLTQYEELKEKSAKLESLFSEKSDHLEKTEKNLTNELKNQKDFNKIKNLLEKELKDSKEKAKSLQAEVSAAQTESQTHLKRISQLEEKVKKFEVDQLTSEAAINDAYAGTQAARKHIVELEEKLRTSEKIILERNQKIEDLVARLNIPKTTNTINSASLDLSASDATPDVTAKNPEISPSPAILPEKPPATQEPDQSPASERTPQPPQGSEPKASEPIPSKAPTAREESQPYIKSEGSPASEEIKPEKIIPIDIPATEPKPVTEPAPDSDSKPNQTPGAHQESDSSSEATSQLPPPDAQDIQQRLEEEQKGESDLSLPPDILAKPDTQKEPPPPEDHKTP